MSTSVVKCYQQCSLCDAIIIILPASITRLPTTNTNTCSGWLHPLGRSALSGVICRTNYTAGVCVSEPPTDKTDTWLLLRVCRNGLAHLGSPKKYEMMGDNLWLQTFCRLPPDILRSAPETTLYTSGTAGHNSMLVQHPHICNRRAHQLNLMGNPQAHIYMGHPCQVRNTTWAH